MRKDKTTAGILALFLGPLGIHRFYLNQGGLGAAYILMGFVSCFVLPSLIGVIDALAFFFMSDFEFDQKYNRNLQPVQVHVHTHGKKKTKVVINDSERTRYRDVEEVRIPNTRKTKQNRPERPSRKKPTPPKKQNPYKAKGLTKFKEYDFRAALANFRKALEIDDKDIATHFNLACCYSMEEDVDKALYHLDRAVDLGFKDFDRIKKHDALAFVRSDDDFPKFVKNSYQWKREEQQKNIPPPVEENNFFEDALDEILDLNTPEKEKILLTDIDETPQEINSGKQDKTDIFNTPPPPNPAKKEALTDTTLEKLRQLGKLRDQGILTDDEFQEQKRRLLG